MSVIGVFIGKIEAHNKSGLSARSFLLIPQNYIICWERKIEPFSSVFPRLPEN